MGPPGSGKGTQAKMLAKHKHLAHLSTGEILREAIDSDSELGRKARSAVEGGRLVSDEILFGIVKEYLGKLGLDKGFILDGFPRNIKQAEFLDGLLRDLGMAIDAVLLLDVPEAEVIKRISGRRLCSKCSKEYHVEASPPLCEGECDECGSALQQREDDRPETVAERLQVYKRLTLEMVEFYGGRGMLREVDAVGSISEVHQRVVDSVCGNKAEDRA